MAVVAVANADAVFALAAEAGIAVVDDDIVGQVFTRRETAAAWGDVLNALAARSWIAIPVLLLQRSIMVSAVADEWHLLPMMEELCCVSPTTMSGGKWVEEWNLAKIAS